MLPVNQMVPIGEVQHQQTWFLMNLLYCSNCELVQLGLAVDPIIFFRPEYPYTSGMTRILRDNFAELYAESSEMLGLTKDDLAVDIGSNDGTLISTSRRVVTGFWHRTDRCCKDCQCARHSTIQRYFSKEWRARLGKPWRRQGRHRSQLLRPHRGRACGCRGHPGNACTGWRIHLGIAISIRFTRRPAIRYGLS